MAKYILLAHYPNPNPKTYLHTMKVYNTGPVSLLLNN